MPMIVGVRPLGGPPGCGIAHAGVCEKTLNRFAMEMSLTAAEMPGRILGNTFVTFSASSGRVPIFCNSIFVK
jgi:hypothetical protein